MQAGRAGRLFTQTLVVLCPCGLRDVPDSSRDGAKSQEFVWISFTKPFGLFINACHVLIIAFHIFSKSCHLFKKRCHALTNAFPLCINHCHLCIKTCLVLKNAFDKMRMPFRLFIITYTLFRKYFYICLNYSDITGN